MAKSKICTKCRKQKPLPAFHKAAEGKYGVRADCKECIKVYTRKYNSIHRTKHLEYAKIYNRVHRTERTEYERKYRKTIIGSFRVCFYHMKHRCNNPKNKDYKYYGGRGIKCLFKSSQEFADYIMNKLKIDPRGLTIDRINNDGNYEKGNIRFITVAENNRNRVKRKKIQ